MGDSNNLAVKLLVSMAILVAIVTAVVFFVLNVEDSKPTTFSDVSPDYITGDVVWQSPQYAPGVSHFGSLDGPYIQIVSSERRRSSGGGSSRFDFPSGFFSDDGDSDSEDDTDEEDDDEEDDGDEGEDGEDDVGEEDDEEEVDGEICVADGELIATPPNFKVAFIGDSGHGDNFEDVLRLIRDEDADLVLHQGDLGYDEGNEEAPQLWLDRIELVLDPSFPGGTFPYFYSIGNHDVSRWEDVGGYREILQDRFDAFDISYTGEFEEFGGKTSFQYNNLGIVLVGPGIDDDVAGENHALFIERQLEESPYIWNICSWHKNMRAMQAGGKGDETGWGVYEKCREIGGIVATGHEHSYSRTHVLSDMSEQTIADDTSPYTIRQGQTFAFVSGLGGASIRGQRDDIDELDYFASVYTSDQDANYGALFIEFYVDGDQRKARGYFKDIDGVVPDEFEIYSERELVVDCEGEDIVPEAGFVYADGSRLMLDGVEFRFIGVNVYGLASDEDIYACGPSADHGEYPDEYLDFLFSYLSERGVNAIRFWAFQSFTNNGEDFSSIDRVVDYANNYNVRLIPVLENQWDDCTHSEYKYSSWYSDEYLEPYGDYELSYREYVERIVSRYENETAILMWQLMNEAESETEDGDDDPDSLYGFALDMSSFIKSIDSNHLVSLGTLGTGQSGTGDENYLNLHSIDSIDVVEAHDYHREEEALPERIADDLDVANDLEKPFFIGEAGISVGDDYSHEERAELFDAKIGALFDNGGDGYLIWQWQNSEENFGQDCDGGYCFNEGDPLLDVIEEYSS